MATPDCDSTPPHRGRGSFPRTSPLKKVCEGGGRSSSVFFEFLTPGRVQRNILLARTRTAL